LFLILFITFSNIGLLKTHIFYENEHLLETGEVPCALFAHKEEVEELARSVGGYLTNDKKAFIEIKQAKKP